MTESRLCWSIPEYHMGVPSWGGGSRSWSVAETVPLEGTSWKHHALEAGGRPRGKNCVPSPASLCFCASASLRPRALGPQLKRDPLGRLPCPHHQLSLCAKPFSTGLILILRKWASDVANGHSNGSDIPCRESLMAST